MAQQLSKGTLVCGGITFAITDIRFHASKIEVVGTTLGPTPALIDEPVTIFGEDGQGIGQTQDTLSVRASGRHDIVTVTVFLQITQIAL